MKGVAARLNFSTIRFDRAVSAIAENPMRYWWINFNVNKFKVPRPTGKVIFIVDMLEPGFVMNTDDMAFRFQTGKNDPREIGDFAPYMGFTFFISQRAYEVLNPIIEKSGRSWPMSVGKYQYRFVFIEAVRDGFDYENSEYIRSENTGSIMEVEWVCLKRGFECSLDIFRLTGEPDVTSCLIVSDRFRELYENSNLTGLFFTSVSR